VESVKIPRILILIIVLFTATAGWAQDEVQYSRRFFAQLRAVFGRFRDADLQRAFDNAKPIQCSDLVNDKGEWRTVAFFNEKRELGDWYRSSFEEVKTDLTVFIFNGPCRGDRGQVQLTTKFPVTESIEAYNRRRIALEQVEVNVNAPVRAAFDSQTQAYSFDLPYLFLVEHRQNESVYSLEPPRLVDRTNYAPDVTDHWDCKSITAEAVTYQFLICRTTTLPRDAPGRYSGRTPTFGASAYFILSDGKEASSSVKLSFDGGSDGNSAPVETPAEWETPDSDERLLDVLRNEFRVRFTAPAWAGRIGAAGVLSGGILTRLESSSPAAGADYCVWLPGAASAAEPEAYSMTVRDRDDQSATSITLGMSTAGRSQIGSLQCFFPRSASAAGVTVGRWKSIVGDHVTIQVRE
jgi:hypothetical protein